MFRHFPLVLHCPSLRKISSPYLSKWSLSSQRRSSIITPPPESYCGTFLVPTMSPNTVVVIAHGLSTMTVRSAMTNFSVSPSSVETSYSYLKKFPGCNRVVSFFPMTLVTSSPVMSLVVTSAIFVF